MNRDKFQNIAFLRLKEAEKSLEYKFYSGAYYLAGYCVECALKACIAKNTKQYDFPLKNTKNIYTHELSTLIGSSGLQTKLDADCKMNVEFASNWNTVQDWSEKSRYEVVEQARAVDMIKAISDKENGVLKWIKQYW